MEQKAISDEAHIELLKAIFKIILKKGMKRTTMDNVAAELSMSKRTLYEIFENKETMLRELICYFHNQYHRQACEIFESSGSVMEGIYRVLKLHQNVMNEASKDFFLDMDEYYKDLRNLYNDQSNKWNSDLAEALKLGVSQGVFRTDVNYPVTIRMTRLQMESLKRMEEYFPPDVTLPEAYDAICIGFLRSIASPKGMQILDKIREDEPESEIHFKGFCQ